MKFNCVWSQLLCSSVPQIMMDIMCSLTPLGILDPHGKSKIIWRKLLKMIRRKSAPMSPSCIARVISCVPCPGSNSLKKQSWMSASSKQNWLGYPADSNDFYSGYRNMSAGSNARSKLARSKSYNQIGNFCYFSKPTTKC